MFTSRSTRATAASSSSSRRSNRWKYELCKNLPLLFFLLFSFSLLLRSLYTSSSAYANRWKYDVFLSFRGDDTRTTFTDHLSLALLKADINTFVDYQLRRGENIQSELYRGIEGSRIAVLVFSKRYAESRWCLRELSKIMRCREDQEGKVVYPIFYDVDPSEVRKQSGSFGEAFRMHERDEDPNEVEQWRKDLKACADLSGWHLKTTADGREGLFIQNVVGDIIGLTKTRLKYELCKNSLLLFFFLFLFSLFLKSVYTSRSAHANRWKYKVFLSYSEDTRTTFTDHLFSALRKADINTFAFADFQLRRGENIQSHFDRELEIEGSRIAIVILSKRYAESRWCLRELSKIMRCREDQEWKVVCPIFYDVNPSQVRKQSGSFGEAFRKHEREEDRKEVEQWRRDLLYCAQLSGWCLEDGSEGLFIQTLVGDIIGLTT